jgi:hypothetical protein
MQDKKTLRPLMEGLTSYREDGYGSALWLPLTDLILDYPMPEDTRYQREGDRLKVYRLNPSSLHWYVCGKYELR